MTIIVELEEKLDIEPSGAEIQGVELPICLPKTACPPTSFPVFMSAKCFSERE